MTETIDISAAPQTARIDELAPDFEARTTHGLVRLCDFRGRWLVFFSHPADFTPVCTSEFIAFQDSKSRFDDLNCDLLGLSVDSLYAHLGWVKDIEASFGLQISFPIVEDISMSISRAYGMIHDGSSSTATVRSLFIIDPQGYVRTLIHYPMNVGRSVDEILRVVAALQEAEAREVATPEGWTPGDATVLPPPLDQAEANSRSNGASGAWYYTQSETVQ